jgi:hypothetical protein
MTAASRFAVGARAAACSVFVACSFVACSGPTDIVAVQESDEGAVASLAPDSDPRSDPRSEARGGTPDNDLRRGSDEPVVVVSGRPLPDWQGSVLEWPLGIPLRELFSGSGGMKMDRALPPAPPTRPRSGARSDSYDWLSRKGSVIDASFMLGAPSVAVTGDAAERLDQLFSQTPRAAAGEPRSLVARDELLDLYLVALEDEGCGVTPWPHGSMACFEHADRK